MTAIKFLVMVFRMIAGCNICMLHLTKFTTTGLKKGYGAASQKATLVWQKLLPRKFGPCVKCQVTTDCSKLKGYFQVNRPQVYPRKKKSPS